MHVYLFLSIYPQNKVGKRFEKSVILYLQAAAAIMKGGGFQAPQVSVSR